MGMVRRYVWQAGDRAGPFVCEERSGLQQETHTPCGNPSTLHHGG